MSFFAPKRRYNLPSSQRQPVSTEVPIKEDWPSLTPVDGIDSLICLALELDIALFSEPVTSYVYPSRAGQGGSFSVSQFGLQYDDIGLSERDTYRNGKPRHGVRLSRADKIVIKHVDASQAADATGVAEDTAVLRPLALEMRVLSHPPLRDHRNIANLIGVAWEPQLDFNRRCWPSLVMEYAHCGNLGDFFSLQGIDFTWDLKAHLSVDILNGLSALHQSGVVHGDLKAENILVTTDKDGRFIAILNDFGFSVIKSDCEFEPATLPGYTPRWVAPEASRGLFEWEAMILLDIYAFGLVFAYIMMSGSHPLSSNGVQLSAEQITCLQSADAVSAFVFTNLRPLYGTTAHWETVLRVLEGTLASSPHNRLLNVSAVKALFDLPDPESPSNSSDRYMSDYESETDTLGGLGEQEEIPVAFFTADEISEGIFDASSDTWKLIDLPQAAQKEICQGLQRKAERLRASVSTEVTGQMTNSRRNSRDAAYALSIAMSLGLGGSYDWQSIIEWLAAAANGGSTKAQADLPRVFAALDGEITDDAKSQFIAGLSCAVACGEDRFVQDSLEELNYEAFVKIVTSLTRGQRAGGDNNSSLWGGSFRGAISTCWDEYEGYNDRKGEAGIASETRVRHWQSPFEVAIESPAGIKALAKFIEHKARNPDNYKGGLSLLHLIANVGITSLVARVLANPQFHVDMPDDDGRTALFFSTLTGNPEMANYLLEQGASAAVGHDKNGNMCLHFVASFQRDSIPHLVQRLCRAGADVNAQNAKLETPLHTTLKIPNSSSTMFCATVALLDNGADPSITDEDGYLPLLWAVRYLQPDALELLLSRLDFPPDKKAYQLALVYEEFLGSPELDRMVFGGSQYGPRLRKTLSLLLTEESCAQFKGLEDGPGESAFYAALRHGALDLAVAINQEIPWLHVNELDLDGRTVLRFAIRHRQATVVETLAAMGADFLFVDPGGENALHVAAEYWPVMLPYLLARIPEASLVSMLDASLVDGGDTPFDKAVLSGNVEAARLLAERGANFTDYRLRTAGDVCTSTLGAVLGLPTASTEQVLFLVDLGASGVTTTDGSTVFHSISSLDRIGLAIAEDPMSYELDSKMAIFDSLLENFPGILRQTNNKGQTALHSATWTVRSDVVARLCELGFDPAAVDASGSTPIDLVSLQRKSGILDTKYLLVRERISKELDKTAEVLQRYA